MKLKQQFAGLNFFLLFFLFDFLVVYSLCLLQLIVIFFMEEGQTSACPLSSVTVSPLLVLPSSAALAGQLCQQSQSPWTGTFLLTL